MAIFSVAIPRPPGRAGCGKPSTAPLHFQLATRQLFARVGPILVPVSQHFLDEAGNISAVFHRRLNEHGDELAAVGDEDLLALGHAARSCVKWVLAVLAGQFQS